MLKHFPNNALKTIKKTHLYSKQPLYYNDVNIDRRTHNGNRITTIGMDVTQIANTKKSYGKNLNIDERITKFKELLNTKHVYRIYLRYFTDLGKINFPTKINDRIKLHLEKKMQKLLESRNVLVSGDVNETEKLERNDSKFNLQILLKQAATKKIRLGVWYHSLGEYRYNLAKNRLTLRHRTYTINQTNDLFNGSKSFKKVVWYIGETRRRY